MVLLVERLSKLYSKLENHHHPHHHQEEEALSASLQAFQSDVSNSVNQLLLNSKPGSGILCFSWIQQCFELLPIINKAFAKLVMDINYPMNKWEAASLEEYLNYSLYLLDLLNSITSSLSNLGQFRLSLSHALSLVKDSPSLALKRLKQIKLKGCCSSKDFKEQENKVKSEERFCSGKEKVIHQAVLQVKGIGLWVCGILLAALCGDAKPYLEIKRLAGGFANSLLISLDSSTYDVIMEKGALLKEVKELNDTVASLAAAIAIGKQSDATEELQRRLEIFERLLENLGKEVDHIFSKILAGRNELLDTVRLQKQ